MEIQGAGEWATVIGYILIIAGAVYKTELIWLGLGILTGGLITIL